MAAAIFRPYHLDGVRTPVAVIGDISVDARYRGRGLGQMLLRYMTDFLDAHFPAGLALVIPTDSARRALARVGWSTAGELASNVYVLDAAPYLQRILRFRPLASGPGARAARWREPVGPPAPPGRRLADARQCARCSDLCLPRADSPQGAAACTGPAARFA